jgi:serine protease Do
MTQNPGRRAGLRAAAALALAALAAGPARLARAGEDPQRAPQADLRTLDRTFREVAGRATPSTVLVKSTLKDGSGRAGFGSGAIIAEEGLVLTCAHVVEMAGDIEVTLSDGEALPATLLGKNPKQDYALLKIDAPRKLAAFALGDSSKLALGEWVLALGHPGGPYADLRPALAVGRVTGLHRRLPVQLMDRYYDDAIRTDAPIFAGNSGGPLVNLRGELVGLNGAILLVNENSYAVPINEIAAHLDALKAGEAVAGRSGGRGAQMGTFDEFEGEDLAKFMARAGRRLFGKDGLGKYFRGKGDMGDEVARSLDRFGKSLEDDGTQRVLRDLAKAFGQGGGGDRGGENPLDQLRDLFGGGRGGDGERPRRAVEAAGPAAYLGITAADGPEAEAVRGVLVDGVMEGSPAARAGIAAGDVVLAVAGKRTPRGDDLARVLAGRKPGDAVAVRVLHTDVQDGGAVEEERNMTITLGTRPKE